MMKRKERKKVWEHRGGGSRSFAFVKKKKKEKGGIEKKGTAKEEIRPELVFVEKRNGGRQKKVRITDELGNCPKKRREWGKAILKKERKRVFRAMKLG